HQVDYLWLLLPLGRHMRIELLDGLALRLLRADAVAVQHVAGLPSAEREQRGLVHPRLGGMLRKGMAQIVESLHHRTGRAGARVKLRAIPGLAHRPHRRPPSAVIRLHLPATMVE